MATRRKRSLRLRRGAFALGVLGAIVLAFAGRLPAGGGPLGLDLALATGPTGELSVAPSGAVAAVEGITPGSGSLSATVSLLNQTDAQLVVRVRARVTIGDPLRALHFELSGDRGTLYSGTLAGLDSFTRGGLVLAPHAIGRLRVHAWVPPGAPAGWQGRSERVTLDYSSSVAGSQRR
jgi:hypothetical protein